MDDYKKIENYISNIATIWHNAGMEASNYVGCMLYVMGLKKMVEEKILEEVVENNKDILSFEYKVNAIYSLKNNSSYKDELNAPIKTP